ncbi:long tail fiber distal subunit [Synechococcus phage S-CREM2]|nr:long tail fiber distal subunit [Synechococcus phage S-CREM2]
MNANKFQGDGSTLTDLSANNITTGTINDARLPATISSDITGNAATATTAAACSGNSATATAATTVSITGTSAATDYRVTLGDGTGTGKNLLSDGQLLYNPSTNVLTSGSFSGSGSGLTSLNASNISSGTISDARLPGTISSDITGNATTVTVSSTNITTDHRVALTDGTGTKSILSDGQLLYNPSTDTLTAGTFSGSMAYSNLTGTPTIPTNNNQLTNGAGYITSSGSITGSSGSCTGNAATATGVAITGTGADVNYRVTLGDGTGVGKNLLSDGGLLYNPSTNVLTAGSFSGSMAYSNLTGTPTIPTNNNQLTNGAGYITSSGSITGNAATATNISGYSGTYWTSNNDGAGSGLDADLLDGENLVDNASTANSVAGRNSAGDIYARLIRQTYANQSTISGGMVFRVNNSTDNYLRVCNSTSAIRTFLNVPTRTGGDASGTWGINITGNSATATAATTVSITGTGADVSYRVTLGDGTGTGKNLLSDGGLVYNPSTNVLTAGSFSGSMAYSNLTGTPTIPTNNNQLTNGAGYITSSGSITGNAATATTAASCTGNSATATAATTVSITGTGANVNYRVTLGDGTGTGKNLLSDGGLLYNPSTNVLTAGTFSGSMAYSNLTGTPTIPTNNNQLTNGAGYITSSGISAGCSTSSNLTVISTAGAVLIRGNPSSNLSRVYRFGKPNANTTEVFFSLNSITADRTFTWPDAGGTIATTTSSDRRLKKDIADVTTQEALNFVHNVEPVTFCWRNEEANGIEHCHHKSAGYIAQQVSSAGYYYMLDTTPMEEDDVEKGNYFTHNKEEVDEATGVSNPDNAYYTLNYEMATPFLHKALADALTKIDELQARLDAAGL